jgi:hypothetical protein
MPAHVPSRHGPTDIPLRQGGVGLGAIFGVPIGNQDVNTGLGTRGVRQLNGAMEPSKCTSKKKRPLMTRSEDTCGIISLEVRGQFGARSVLI